jgi:hypothetical protein
MGSFSDWDCRFFDAQEDVVSIRDANSDNDDKGVSVSVDFDYDVWIRSPKSVRERRRKFMKSMGMSIDGIVVEKEKMIDRIRDSTDSEEEFGSSRLSLSRCSSVSSFDEFGLVKY